MKKGKNDEAWEKLFDKYDILNEIDRNEIFSIRSKQINEFREARLMTKFDHS
ncbi:transcriptional regulator, partial [Enterococcus faecium]|nr:transcriptional regulator [Enterococcus faecium]